ncbi:hypothetical protein ACB092_10G012600 [Castanea dentata]
MIETTFFILGIGLSTTNCTPPTLTDPTSPESRLTRSEQPVRVEWQFWFRNPTET